MEKKDFWILFLDDEIEDPRENPATIAYQALIDEGFTVKKTSKMSEAIDWYYKAYFDLYILDMDMSMSETKDTFEGNGATVGETLRRLSTMTNVIVYSARGTIKDWITTANYHFTRYVHKDETETALTKVVNEIFMGNETTHPKASSLLSPKSSTPQQTLILCQKGCLLQKENLESLVPNSVWVDNLEDMLKSFSKDSFGCAMIFLSRLPGITRIEDFLTELKTIMSFQPKPHIIFGIPLPRLDKQILKVINLNPFRIMNLESPAIMSELKEAIVSARKFFNTDEIFKIPDTQLERFRNQISEEELAIIREDFADESLDDEEEV